MPDAVPLGQTTQREQSSPVRGPTCACAQRVIPASNSAANMTDVLRMAITDPEWPSRHASLSRQFASAEVIANFRRLARRSAHRRRRRRYRAAYGPHAALAFAAGRIAADANVVGACLRSLACRSANVGPKPQGDVQGHDRGPGAVLDQQRTHARFRSVRNGEGQPHLLRGCENDPQFETPSLGRMLIWPFWTAPRSNVPGALMVTSDVAPVSTIVGDTVIAA